VLADLSAFERIAKAFASLKNWRWGDDFGMGEVIVEKSNARTAGKY